MPVQVVVVHHWIIENQKYVVRLIYRLVNNYTYILVQCVFARLHKLTTLLFQQEFC